MALVKCPRCDLNYITENEKYCKICHREMKGESMKEEMEICSACNAAPALPGKDLCLSCQKDLLDGSQDERDDSSEATEKNSIELHSVSTMDEIVPQIHEDIPEGEFGEIESELSLERVIEDEQNEDDEDDESEM